MVVTRITPEIQLESHGERSEQWQRIENRWTTRLEENNQSSALEINTVEDLKSALKDMLASYNGKEQDDLICSLSPLLDHFNAFARAINSASQYKPVACLVWGGLQALLESASQYRHMSNEVVKLIQELDEAIPSIEQWAKVPGFGYAMQDLFDEFMSFCLQASSYYKSSTIVNLVRNMIPPFVRASPRQMLDDTKQRIQRRLRRFRQAAKDLDYQTQLEISGSLPSLLTKGPSEITPSGQEEKVDFPVNTLEKGLTRAFIGRDDLLKEIEKILQNRKTIDESSDQDPGPPTRFHFQYGWQQKQQKQQTKAQKTLSTEAAALPDGQAVNSTNDVSSQALERTDDRAQADNLQPPTQTKVAGSEKQSASFYPATCVLHGLGGMGKTQAALAYYNEHRKDYDAVFWVEAEHNWTLMEHYTRIANKLCLLDIKTTDIEGEKHRERAVEASRNWLQTTKRRWLLIFDNMEDTDDLDRYMPSECRNNSSIIVTTQTPITPPWVENLGIVQIKELSRENAGLCIFEYLGRKPKDPEELELACEVADHVGRLPLAMATIGGYVSQSQTSIEEFFTAIKESSTVYEAAPRVKSTKHYEKSLTTVFEKAFNALKDEQGKDKPAKDLLNILAFLDPDSIPEEIFTEAIKSGLLPSITSKHQLHGCYFELRSRQLIRRDTSSKGNFISVHRAVQYNVLLDLSKNFDKRWVVFKQALKLVQQMLPEPSPLTIPEEDMWPPYAKYGRQVLELRTHCLWPEPPVELPLDFAQILSDMGTFMWFSGQLNEGADALETAQYVVDDNKVSLGHPLRANIYSTLGIITSFSGVSQRERSFELRKQGYESRMAGLGQKSKSQRSRNEDILMWNVHSDMAFGWIQEENFEETSKIMEECLEQYKKWDVEDEIPYEYAKYYQLKSFCYMAEQRPRDAVKAINSCLELMIKASGEEHPMVQVIKFCFANLLWHSGRSQWEKALETNKAVLRHRKHILGEFNYFTLESYSTCGKLCAELDVPQLDEAQRYLKNCLQRRKRAVWNEEGVTRAQHRYACVLRKLAHKAEAEGDIEQAVELHEEAEDQEKIVGKKISQYCEDYSKYLDKTEEREAILDQMVSFWAGRYTGKLKQPDVDMLDIENLSISAGSEGGISENDLIELPDVEKTS